MCSIVEHISWKSLTFQLALALLLFSSCKHPIDIHRNQNTRDCLFLTDCFESHCVCNFVAEGGTFQVNYKEAFHKWDILQVNRLQKFLRFILIPTFRINK